MTCTHVHRLLPLIAVYCGTLPTSSFKLNYDVLQCTATNVTLHTTTVGECPSHRKKSRCELPEKVLIAIAETEFRNLEI